MLDVGAWRLFAVFSKDLGVELIWQLIITYSKELELHESIFLHDLVEVNVHVDSLRSEFHHSLNSGIHVQSCSLSCFLLRICLFS